MPLSFVNWRPGESVDDMITRLADAGRQAIASAGQDSVVLVAINAFMTHALNLDDEEFQKLLEALQMTPVVTVYLGNSGSDRLEHFSRFCETLQSISTIKKVYLTCSQGRFASFAIAAGILRRIVGFLILKTGWSGDSNEHVPEFVALLPGLNKLSIVSYYVQSPADIRALAASLDGFKALPSITAVHMNGSPDYPIGSDNSSILGRLLNEFNCKVRFHEVAFESAEACRIFFAPPVTADTAPTTSLSVHSWPARHESILPEFLSAFANALPRLRLRSIDIIWMVYQVGEGHPHFDEDWLRNSQQLVPNIIRAAATSQGLTSMYLPLLHLDGTEAIDQALAVIARSSLSLETVDLLAGPSIDGKRVNLPWLLLSLKDNYTLKEVGLLGSGDSWDANLVANLKIMTRLNANGRSYMRQNNQGPPNQLDGLRLLSRVGDDLDCVYTHLREVPALCRVHGPRKRDAEDESVAERVRKRRRRRQHAG